MNTENFKQILIEKKEKLEQQVKYLASEDPYKQTDRETAVTDDTITEIEEHDRIYATVEELQRELVSVEQALQRIEDGKFGICVQSGDPIEAERLEIMPTATLCLACQKKQNKG